MYYTMYVACLSVIGMRLEYNFRSSEKRRLRTSWRFMRTQYDL